MSKRITVISLANPRGHLHGGAVRLRGFKAAFAANDYDVEIYEYAQAPTGEVGGALWQLVGRLKRQMLPMPLVRRGKARNIAGSLARHGALLMSTVPTVTYALTAIGHVVDWADYYDLPYRFAASEAEMRSGVSGRTARRQAHVLAEHHARSAGLTRVTTYAGYGDYLAAGCPAESHWLPSVVERLHVPPRRASSSRVAGFLANFDYWPNRDALLNLVQNWLTPLSTAGFRVAIGGFGVQGIRDLPSAVENLGTVNRPEDFYAAVDVVLVPVRRGSGIKVKAIEGLLSGRPVIVDPHVLEGFPEGYRQFFEVFTGLPPHYERLIRRRDATAAAVEQAACDFSLARQQEVIRGILGRLEDAGV